MAMPKRAVDFEAVRKIALELPGVEESSAYAARAFKVHGKLLACTPVNKSAEPGSLAVRVGINDRAHLLAEAPDVYYVTDHYAPFPMVLVRLNRVTPGVLRDLLRMSHKFVTAESKPRSPRRKRSQG